MTRFRFVHAADLHLDSPFRGLKILPAAIRDEIRQSTFRSLERLVELAIREQVQFVVIAGDVYDLEDRSVRAQLRFHKEMERLAEAGISVYIAHGNHDPLDGKRMLWNPPEHIHVFGGNEAETRAVVDEQGRIIAHVHGISFPTATVTDNLAQRFRVKDPAVFNIAVLHTNVDAASAHDNYAPSTRAQLRTLGMDYWALGHIHVRSVLHEDPYIVYPGNVQGRSMKETGAKGCYLVDVDEDRSVRLTFHALDEVRWLQSRLSIDGCSTEMELKQRMEDALHSLRHQADGRPGVVRLTLTGRSELYRQLKNSSLLEDLRAEWNEEQSMLAEQGSDVPFLWLEDCRTDINSAVDRALLMKQDSFVGDLLRSAEELKRDSAALTAFAEEVANELLRSKTGKYLREGQAGSNGMVFTDHEELLELLGQAEAWLLDMLVEGGEAG